MNAQEYKIKGWFAARDQNGAIHAFEVEPRRIEGKGYWWDRDYVSLYLPENTFPDLSFDDEPIEVELTIKKI